MEELLRAHLLASAGVTALVSTRVTWLTRPQAAALPAVTLQLVGSSRTYGMSGPSDLVGNLVQVDVWAGTYATMKQTARAVIAALHELKDAPLQAFVESEDESSEAQDGPDTAGSTTFYRTRLDCRVWFTPT